MTKVRVYVFLSTILVVGIVGIFASFYARGYRLNFKALSQGRLTFEPNGILVIKSEPDGASVIINGDLKTATNTTLSLSPGVYDIEVKKDGFFPWKKRLTIEKEIVTSANVSLFRSAPSLSPVTFSGALSPTPSEDGTKIAFVVPPSKDTDPTKVGLWTMDILTLPLGFSNEPRKITDGDLTAASFMFSPDSRQILLTTSKGIFLLDSGSFTPQTQMVNVALRKDTILAQWKEEKRSRAEGLVRNLPTEFSDILLRKSSDYVFSPDETMVLYTASAAGTLSPDLIKPLPGASTQPQERTIMKGHTYVYDTKEDRNFLISKDPIALQNPPPERLIPVVRWLTTSRHLILAEPDKVSVMDYDGTNRQQVYFGAYSAPYAFPFTNATRLLILTNLGASSSTPNLYTLTVK